MHLKRSVWPKNPVRHVAAVARAERGLAILVDERIRFLDVIESLHQIDIRFAAPIAADRVGELLSVTGRAMEIDHDDDIAVGREQLRIPAIRPRISPRALRSAVDQKLQRIFLVRIESRRLDEKSLHVFIVRAFERERLHRLHVDLRQQRVVHVGDCCNRIPWSTSLVDRSRSPNFVWRAIDIAREKQGMSAAKTRSSAWSIRDAIRLAGAVLTAVDRSGEDRRARRDLLRLKQSTSTRWSAVPGETSDRSIELLRQIAHFS